MPKFIVPVEMAPGAARCGVGFFRPGQVMEWPDACTEKAAAAGMEEKPNRFMVPLDKAGYDMLKSYYPEHDVAKPQGMPEPEPEPAVQPQSIKDAVREHSHDEVEPVMPKTLDEKPARKGRGKRAADQ